MNVQKLKIIALTLVAYVLAFIATMIYVFWISLTLFPGLCEVSSVPCRPAQVGEFTLPIVFAFLAAAFVHIIVRQRKSMFREVIHTAGLIYLGSIMSSIIVFIRPPFTETTLADLITRVVFITLAIFASIGISSHYSWIAYKKRSRQK